MFEFEKLTHMDKISYFLNDFYNRLQNLDKLILFKCPKSKTDVFLTVPSYSLNDYVSTFSFPPQKRQ